ncbi:hypothetical protein ACGFZL_00785 [Streptomyces sp. NPDC048182]|uniref:hypothetical protein n=1 Tax=Streptomyces sp. NPDC048182 TaxID=3365507 RepID=UPI003723E7D7
MPDVTRQPGGSPAERPDKPLDADREGAPTAPDPVPAAGADHTAGARPETTPGLHTENPAPTGAARTAASETSTGKGTGIAADPHTVTEPHTGADPRTGADTGLGGTHPRTDTDTGTGLGTHTGAKTPGAAGTTAAGATGAASTATGAATSASPTAAKPDALVPHDELDKLGQRLHHAVAGFIDTPRESVEEADRVLEELATRVTDALTHRRRTLRTSWHEKGEDTEQLRLALKDYRELADRLTHL